MSAMIAFEHIIKLVEFGLLTCLFSTRITENVHWIMIHIVPEAC